MRRLLALLVLAASTALATTAPAHAGGPTSVLITEPGSGNATALYYSDPGYADLDAMIAGAKALDGEPKDLGTRGLNLTWMVHDVSPWRTQQVYLDAAGGPVVATYGTDYAGDPAQVAWGRVVEGKALVHLLDQLLKPGSVPDLAPVDIPASPEPIVTERVVTETAWWSLAGWRWLLLGLLAGAGAVLLVGRVRSGEREPRQVLVDLDPGVDAAFRR